MRMMRMVRMVTVVMVRVVKVAERSVELRPQRVLGQHRVHFSDQAVDGGGIVADDENATDPGHPAVQTPQAPPQRSQVLAVDDVDDVE